MSTSLRGLGGALCGVFCCWAAAPVQAQDLEKYLPAETNFVVRVNFKQVFGSELLRRTVPAVAHKYGDQFVEMVKVFAQLDPNIGKQLQEGALEAFVAALKDRDKVNQGLDTMKEFLTEVAFAGDARNEEPKVLIFVRSPAVTPALIGLMLGFVENTQPGMFKKSKLGKHQLYEVTPPNQEQSLFFCVPASGLVVISLDKEHLKTALEGAESNKTHITKELQGLLGQYKPSQAVFFAGIKDADGKKEVTLGSVTMNEGLGADFSLDVGSADAAKERTEQLNEQLAEAMSSISGLMGEMPEAKSLVKELGSIKAKTDGNKVVIQAKLDGKVFDALLKIEKKEKSDKDDDK